MGSRGLLPSCPLLMRIAGAIERGPIRTSVRDRPHHVRLCPPRFSTATERLLDNERVQRRYGTANEPPPRFAESQPREGRGRTTDTPARQDSEPRDTTNKHDHPSPADDASTKDGNSKIDTADAEAGAVAEEVATKEAVVAASRASASTSTGKPDLVSNGPPTPSSKPLETVLNMPPPQNAEKDRPPQLHPPPYIHHFDTYGLVQRLNSGGFSDDQSTTIMKAVRTILADNMDLARRGLVSKSNVENETYLFKAACSELKTELENNRKGELDKNRTRRSLLQHEVDILGQKITQEASGLRDELKGMFDDRKMTQRNEQRNMENRIQELNYKITVALNSDAKTEVEGVRWVLTRRAATALGVSVLMILATLNYARYMSSTQEKERKQHEQFMKDAATNHQTTSAGTQTDYPTGANDALLASEGVNLG